MKTQEVKGGNLTAEVTPEVREEIKKVEESKKEEVKVTQVATTLKKENLPSQPVAEKETSRPQRFGAQQYCSMYNHTIAIQSFLSHRFSGQLKTVEEWTKTVNRAFNY